jgi:hypothetical protein
MIAIYWPRACFGLFEIYEGARMRVIHFDAKPAWADCGHQKSLVSWFDSKASAQDALDRWLRNNTRGQEDNSRGDIVALLGTTDHDLNVGARHQYLLALRDLAEIE